MRPAWISLTAVVGPILLLWIGVFPTPVAAEEIGRQVIDRAIVAHGGAARVKAAKGMTWTERGTYYGMGEGVPYTGEYAFQAPDRFKMLIAGAFTIVVDGKQGWVRSGDVTREMRPEEQAEQAETLHASWVVTLAPLDDPAYRLTSAGETQIQGKDAVGVKVSREGRRPVTLWFHKATFELLKSTTTVKSPEMNYQEVLEETVVEQAELVGGLRVPRRVTILRDGKKFVEATMENYQVAEKLPDSHFAKP